MAQQTPYEWYNQQMVTKQERERMTAVEWLIKRYHDYGTLYYDDMTQAKEMEKEQIQDAWMDGNAYQASPREKSEQYYNETFKKQTI